MLGIEVPYNLRYHLDVKEKDLSKLNRTIQKRIRTALAQRLLVAPEKYSEPLSRTLERLPKTEGWGLPDCLKPDSGAILILGICHRKDVY